MIELPRACFVADRIARIADFFSFGTNDLTQTALGFSRDDVESRILGRLHGETGSSTAAPSRRSTGRGSAGWSGSCLLGQQGPPRPRSSASAASTPATPTRSPSSQLAGIDYVSCSPYRVPIARVAAAQAAAARR